MPIGIVSIPGVWRYAKRLMNDCRKKLLTGDKAPSDPVNQRERSVKIKLKIKKNIF